ncbi:prephenate dehydrogenase [Bacteroidetes bacterium endosymbiont of Geopemphigus sp.]|uniref:prephenate dehydrogenase n=1 Tax=Bacteroidetes bacterium endosymbiont of Geopemphigus sp. TaxID=2047937 RepID=UPI000CD28838|nr:prephenate dehydrogenase [Bacteroidetes bacterium endosymbiont of Geopemphigus sp.]
MTIGIIGLGLIGGSIAMDLRISDFAKHIIGNDYNSKNIRYALQRALIDEVMDIKNMIEHVDLIILAVPVNVIKKMLPDLLHLIYDKTVILDTGSTKHEICQSVVKHPKRNQFVATHPIAGTEYSGPQAALTGLFNKKTVVLCNTEESAPEALKTVKKLYRQLNAEFIELPSDVHDKHAAYLSHLSHIIAFSLAKVALGFQKKSTENVFYMAGSGFSSTARLAKSSPETWLPIFQSNKAYLLEAIEGYLQKFMKIQKTLQEDDLEALCQYMAEANDIKKYINPNLA